MYAEHLVSGHRHERTADHLAAVETLAKTRHVPFSTRSVIPPVISSV